MKKGILIAAIILMASMNGLFAQRNSFSNLFNPIPSYDYQINGQTAVFQDRHQGPITREKRDMDVVISSSSTNPFTVFATVWMTKTSNQTVLGPFTVFVGELLSVPIDNAIWTVTVQCQWSITADIWIE